MYLSRVSINPYRRSTMKALASPEIIHAAVMSSFPPTGSEGPGRVLWRTDKVGDATYILVQSGIKPDFTHIVEQFGWPESGQKWDVVDYDGFLSGIKNGDIRMFRLRANPVRSVNSGIPGVRGKVCHHITAEQQEGWLRSKADRLGVSFDAEGCGFTITSRSVVRFKRGKGTVSIGTADYEGVLRITDSEKLKEAIRSGIGREKAYGYGMLTLSSNSS